MASVQGTMKDASTRFGLGVKEQARCPDHANQVGSNFVNGAVSSFNSACELPTTPPASLGRQRGKNGRTSCYAHGVSRLLTSMSLDRFVRGWYGEAEIREER